jgi:hypothetical protein
MDNVQWLREYNPRADETLRPMGDTAPLTKYLRQCADELERLRERVAEYEHSIQTISAMLNPQEVAIDKGWEAEDVLNDVLDGFAGRTEKDT